VGKRKTAETLERHASTRVSERFDFELAKGDYKNACNCIRLKKEIDGCAPIVHVEKQSCNRTMWLLEIKGRRLLAVYDKSRKAIATFFPVEYQQRLVDESLRRLYGQDVDF